MTRDYVRGFSSDSWRPLCILHSLKLGVARRWPGQGQPPTSLDFVPLQHVQLRLLIVYAVNPPCWRKFLGEDEIGQTRHVAGEERSNARRGDFSVALMIREQAA